LFTASNPASTSTPNPAASSSTPNPTQSGVVDVGDTISESSGSSAVAPAIPHRSLSSTPEVQPADCSTSCDGLGSKDSGHTQTHGTSDASPACNDDSGAVLMAEGRLDVVGSLPEKDPTPGDSCGEFCIFC
jgi:hypothetical protein